MRNLRVFGRVTRCLDLTQMCQFSTLFAVALIFTTAASGSGCNTEINVPIRFSRGAACWSYSG